MISRIRAVFDLVGRFMARVWLTALYFTLVLPFGIVARIRLSRERRAPPAWQARTNSASSVQGARQQY
jgi:hypothetical protein